MAPSYGTLSNNDRNHVNGLIDPADQERATLLNKDQETFSHRLKHHLTTNIDKTWGYLVLLACYIITGLLDSSSTQAYGSFVSMQTGNTVYVGLGLAAPNASTRWIRSLISVSCFCAGSAFFSAYHRHLGARKRWVMLSSYTLQTLLMIIAAVMITFGPSAKGSEGPVTVWVGVPLALIAFQSAGQAVTSRVLQYGGLTSVVLTSIYCDLFSDQKLFTSGLRENPERNRRAAAPILLLIGAIIGGVWSSHTTYGLTGAIWTAVALKIGVTLAWLFWRAEPGSH
ncbi:hypothetical protein EJ03DRAFT_50527 [Teratosphaeria nubilosa]|uniref:DUF1275 domain protein n=1 Tax=Teratosphaeria nubilosa TaxID=161662 RepID=A0A6G1LDI8_9PEZI|nr:hypothetical protein EJ03DRAFT_50527 [Teratosphaeria nubilosa]